MRYAGFGKIYSHITSIPSLHPNFYTTKPVICALVDLMEWLCLNCSDIEFLAVVEFEFTLLIVYLLEAIPQASSAWPSLHGVPAKAGT